MYTEIVLKHKEFLLEGVLSLHSILVLDGLLPHPHELPSLELLEEGQLLYMIVGITFNKPLAQRQKLDGRVIFVQSQTFSRQGIVLLLSTALIRGHK